MIDNVHPGDLQAWIAQMRAHGRALVLDVREASELELARIAPAAEFDFLHIPMGAIPARLPELDATRPVACLCHHGGRSARVAAFLESQGFKHLANIHGGISAWSMQVDPSIPQY